MAYAGGLIKNRYTGRTFIQTDQRLRQFGVKMKSMRSTSCSLMKLLRDAGAKEVHLGVTSPPFRFPCNPGLDVANRDHRCVH